MKEQYWTTKDGTKIAVGDMSVDHLRNVLRMLIRENMIVSNAVDDGPSYRDDEAAFFGVSEWWKE